MIRATLLYPNTTRQRYACHTPLFIYVLLLPLHAAAIIADAALPLVLHAGATPRHFHALMRDAVTPRRQR